MITGQSCWTLVRAFLKVELFLLHVAACCPLRIHQLELTYDCTAFLFLNKKKMTCLLYSTATGFEFEYEGRFSKTNKREAIHRRTHFCSAASWMHYRTIQSVKLNGPLQCAFESTLCASLTRLHPAQRLFLHHIISVIIYHSKVICSQPSLCWAICMTNWMPSMLISRYFTPRLD